MNGNKNLLKKQITVKKLILSVLCLLGQTLIWLVQYLCGWILKINGRSLKFQQLNPAFTQYEKDRKAFCDSVLAESDCGAR